MRFNLPVRKIVPNSSSITGKLVSWKAGAAISFESSLERDYAYLLEFDSRVESYGIQPMRIRFKNQSGRNTSYTPDFFVEYYQSEKLKPEIIEVKYKDELRENWRIFKPKFKAAIEYARKREFNFRIITEYDVRTPRLFNSRFLLKYQNAPEPVLTTEIMLRIRDMGNITTVKNVIDSFNDTEYNRGRKLYALWYLVSIGRIFIDLDENIQMNSEIWIKP